MFPAFMPSARLPRRLPNRRDLLPPARARHRRHPARPHPRRRLCGPFPAQLKADRGELPSVVSREFEIGWTAATLFILRCSCSGGRLRAALGAGRRRKTLSRSTSSPSNGCGRRSTPTAQREINELHVPLGKPVRLIMTSQDVIHSFFVPAFRIKQDVLPGRYTETWFQATKPGVFHLFCAEYCGTDHSRMIGSDRGHATGRLCRWLSGAAAGDDLAHEGAAALPPQAARLPRRPHRGFTLRTSPAFTAACPARRTGSTVTADEAYIRDSILQPRRDVAAGYEPIMPSFAAILERGAVSSARSRRPSGRSRARSLGGTTERSPHDARRRSEPIQRTDPAMTTATTR